MGRPRAKMGSRFDACKRPYTVYFENYRPWAHTSGAQLEHLVSRVRYASYGAANPIG